MNLFDIIVTPNTVCHNVSAEKILGNFPQDGTFPLLLCLADPCRTYGTEHGGIGKRKNSIAFYVFNFFL